MKKSETSGGLLSILREQASTYTYNREELTVDKLKEVFNDLFNKPAKSLGGKYPSLVTGMRGWRRMNATTPEEIAACDRLERIEDIGSYRRMLALGSELARVVFNLNCKYGYKTNLTGNWTIYLQNSLYKSINTNSEDGALQLLVKRVDDEFEISIQGSDGYGYGRCIREKLALCPKEMVFEIIEDYIESFKI